MGSGLVRGVCLDGDSGKGMREGLSSFSLRKQEGEREKDGRGAFSFNMDFRYQWLLECDFCHAGGAHGPSDSASDSGSSCGALHREECMFERPL